MTIAARGLNEWIVPSQSTPGTRYLVKRHASALMCSCPAGFNRRARKHITAVAATLSTQGPSAAETAALFKVPRRTAQVKLITALGSIVPSAATE